MSESLEQIAKDSAEWAHNNGFGFVAKDHLQSLIHVALAPTYHRLEGLRKHILLNGVGALLDDLPMSNGEYVHTITCNASRKQPVGNDMCSCGIGRRIIALTAERDRFRDFILDLANDRDDRVSPGVKGDAERVLDATRQLTAGEQKEKVSAMTESKTI